MSFSLLISFDFETIKNMKLFQIVNYVVKSRKGKPHGIT